ncbi:MAG TPA: hypothetical protein VGK74_24845 [Symbiobacteriaceae bacterium]
MGYVEVTSELKLGLELLARNPATLKLGTFFETWIATPSGTLRRSLGRDEYHLALVIDAGRRLAATGRTHLCQVDLADAGLGINQAREATPAEAEIPPGCPVVWGIRTNRFLDLAALTEGTSARLIVDAKAPIAYGIDHPLILAEEVAPGRYILDISALLLP